MSRKQRRGKKTKQQTDVEQKQLELTDLVGQNLEAVVAYQLRTEQDLDHHQHVIEAITKNVGRPRFLYLVLLIVVLWIGAQGLLASFGRASFDPAPFSWLQGLISLSGLQVATMLLITQNRQAKRTEHRRHLDLQVSLLVEQKVTKVIALIALVEELRRDLPTVQNRVDFQAEAMQEVIDSTGRTWCFGRYASRGIHQRGEGARPPKRTEVTERTCTPSVKRHRCLGKIHVYLRTMGQHRQARPYMRSPYAG